MDLHKRVKINYGETYVDALKKIVREWRKMGCIYWFSGGAAQG